MYTSILRININYARTDEAAPMQLYTSFATKLRWLTYIKTLIIRKRTT